VGGEGIDVKKKTPAGLRAGRGFEFSIRSPLRRDGLHNDDDYDREAAECGS
jgi:hypothetical protein